MRLRTILGIALIVATTHPVLAADGTSQADGKTPTQTPSNTQTASNEAAARETARHLMDLGHARFEAKDYAGALDTYRGADALVHVPTTRLGVGRALIELGRWVEARDTLLQVAATPEGTNEPSAFERARATAKELAAELDKRIPSVEARVSSPTDGSVRIVIDGLELPAAASRLPRRVDPGIHSIEARALGFQTFRSSVTVTEGSVLAVPIALRLDNGDADATSRAGFVGVPLRTWSWIGVGFGAASLITGSVTGGLALARMSDLDERCPSHVCSSSSERALHDDMTTLATTSNVLIPLGIAAASAGAVGLWLTSPAAGLTSLRVGPGSITIEGAF